jgi:2-methylcitrate dehydratase PrpD
MHSSVTDVTASLARFLVASRWDDLPDDVRHQARRTLLNGLGTGIGGSRDASVTSALAALRAFDGPPEATVIGTRERSGALTAAFVNAVSINVHDFDDTHLPTIIHPAAPIAPALLALAEHAPERVAGADLLHALVLGVEVACRLGNAVTPYHYGHGWHITSTCGVVGAAAAASRLLRLDAGGTAHALGLAAAQAAGLVEGLGSMAKSVSVGNAARNGIVAALLARAGVTAAPHMLEGARGFLHVMGSEPDLRALVDGLGEAWESARVTYKPYPCGIVLHPVVDAVLALRARRGLTARDVDRVTVRGNPLLRQRADRPAPRSGREAQVSLQHTVAVCLLHGAAGIREFTDAAAADAAALELGARVEVEDDDALAADAAEVTVHVAAGSAVTERVDHPLGSLARPLSDAQIEAKARDLAAFAGVDVDVGRLFAVGSELDHLDDAALIVRLTVP